MYEIWYYDAGHVRKVDAPTLDTAGYGMRSRRP